MKNITKITLIALAALLLFSSCNFNSAEPPISFIDKEEPTWKDVFEGYWNGLNNNYIFWNVDSPSNEWDKIYDEYAPKFAELGAVDYAVQDRTKEAMRLFSEMSYDLSDGHFAVILPKGDGTDFTFSPSYARFCEKFAKKDVTKDDIIDGVVNGTVDSLLDDTNPLYLENSRETTTNHFDYMLDEKTDENLDDWGRTSEGLFTSYKYTAKYPDWNNNDDFFDPDSFDAMFKEWMVMKRGTLFAIVGITKGNVVNQKVPENCLYFGFNSFDFAKDIIDGTSETSPISDFVTIYTTMKQNQNHDLVGMVVDLRGNGGGISMDKEILFGDLVPADKPFHYANEIYKTGNNRLDYTAPVPMYLHRGDYFVKDLPRSPLADKPIVAIINSGTVSNGEITAILVSELPNGAVVGGNSWGGIGELTGQKVPNLNAGEFTVGSYITTVYTPYTRVETLDGKCYEGTGVVPDIPVEFNYEDYWKNGEDHRLAAAFKYIADNQ